MFVILHVPALLLAPGPADDDVVTARRVRLHLDVVDTEVTLHPKPREGDGVRVGVPAPRGCPWQGGKDGDTAVAPTCRWALCSKCRPSSSLHCTGRLRGRMGLGEGIRTPTASRTCGFGDRGAPAMLEQGEGARRRSIPAGELTHPDVVLAAVAPDVVGHLEPGEGDTQHGAVTTAAGDTARAPPHTHRRGREDSGSPQPLVSPHLMMRMPWDSLRALSRSGWLWWYLLREPCCREGSRGGSASPPPPPPPRPPPPKPGAGYPHPQPH